MIMVRDCNDQMEMVIIDEYDNDDVGHDGNDGDDGEDGDGDDGDDVALPGVRWKSCARSSEPTPRASLTRRQSLFLGGTYYTPPPSVCCFFIFIPHSQPL